MTSVVSVRDLRKTYGGFTALHGVSFDIERGETFALLGPNGAGKSTTIEILEGYRDRTSGEASVLGVDPSRGGLDWKAQLGIVLQSTGESGNVTVREQLAHFAGFYPNSRDVDEVLASVGLVDIRVIILTTYETDANILTAIEAGASGYLLKAAPPEEILAGIRSVARGEVALAPSIAAMLVGRMKTPATPGLSARKKEVLALVAQGKSNPAIAKELFLGEATVKTHLLHVFEKLEVNDRTRAVTKAMELGIL